jgi:hypothetical protein
MREQEIIFGKMRGSSGLTGILSIALPPVLAFNGDVSRLTARSFSILLIAYIVLPLGNLVRGSKLETRIELRGPCARGCCRCREKQASGTGNWVSSNPISALPPSLVPPFRSPP